MKILVLDNYDSFVYNLVHLIRELGYGDNLDVIRNDKLTLEDVEKYDKILLSPGPGIPSEAGLMLDILKEYGSKKPVLGVCLGHQAIGEVYGASLKNLSEVVHGQGKNTQVTEKDILFEDVSGPFESGRYHSWVIDPVSDLNNLVVTAKDDSGNIMAVRHKEYNVRGVQFHPESILTGEGKKIILNWLKN